MINVALLRQLIAYDPQTGELRWLPRPEEMFPRRRSWMTWNTRYSGQLALNAVDSHRYKHGRIFGRKYYAHRVAMALMAGEWPEEVDHISGDVTDNRAENLRSVTHKENCRNVKRPKHNTSGVIGVHWSASAKKWVAQIVVDGRGQFLGQFKRKEDAIQRRRAAEEAHWFHANHGRIV